MKYRWMDWLFSTLMVLLAVDIVLFFLFAITFIYYEVTL